MSEMKTIAVSGLIGAALDWAVAKAEGIKTKAELSGDDGSGNPVEWLSWDNGFGPKQWSPSSDWSVCGPLIAKYHAEFKRGAVRMYTASLLVDGKPFNGIGATHLEAFCRGLVHAKLGRDVEYPARYERTA
ncbi:DUF2591 family protein [Pseudomonas putida]|nr:DUF2591 family protein [Pseudomonas putida]